MSFLRPIGGLLAVLASVPAPCQAAAQPSSTPQPALSEALQQEAMTCVGEAMQICPDVLTSEDHGLACMTGKRQAFTPRCRVIYDKVAHALDAAPHDRAKPHGF